MRIAPIGIDVRTSNGQLQWCLNFRDMDSPAIKLLSDAYRRRGQEGGGFVLCPLFGRKCKAFTGAAGTSNSVVLTTMTRMAKSYVGISLNVDSTKAMGAPEFLKQRDCSRRRGNTCWRAVSNKGAYSCTWHCALWYTPDPVRDQRFGRI